MSNVEQEILNNEVMNRCALSLSISDDHFEIHVIDIRSAFAKATAGQVLDIQAPFKGAF
jgi:hypothetical protein